ncbi:MAG: hypothetical protein KatS3mg115_1818 [Candidatus Poribacteria bacterium]|nr:MAG: hypothetical protein KatS3mg115_1818 [Candidatus Poribacteria bacterium]
MSRYTARTGSAPTRFWKRPSTARGTGRTIARYLKESYRDRPHSEALLRQALREQQEYVEALRNREGPERLAHIRDQLKDSMMKKCGVFREEKTLAELQNELLELKERFQKAGIQDHGRRFNTELLEAMELDHLIEVSQVIVAGALARRESRGGHARRDYPNRDDENWLKHTLAYRGENGIPQLRYKPVTITKYQPQERKY